MTDDLAPPVNLSGILMGSYANLEWNSPGVDGLQGYNIYRNGALIASRIQNLHFEDNLEGLPQISYSYMITAQYEAGESPFTDPVIIDFSGSLNPVEDLVVARLGAHIALSWSAVPTAMGYNVYRGTDPQSLPSEMTLIASPTSPTYLDSNIINMSDESVFYIVTATR